jgi:hypothetical protein
MGRETNERGILEEDLRFLKYFHLKSIKKCLPLVRKAANIANHMKKEKYFCLSKKNAAVLRGRAITTKGGWRSVSPV